MPFVRSGKKPKKARQIPRGSAKAASDRAQIERAVNSAWFAISQPRLCVQMCVLLERILHRVHPRPRFALRLGSLVVSPEHGTLEPLRFDPRGPAGAIDAHAWLEDSTGRILDPSILITLAAEGYAVDDDDFLLADRRTVSWKELRFEYEVIAELELVGVEESEPHLARQLALALYGEARGTGTIYLDVRWKE